MREHFPADYPGRMKKIRICQKKKKPGLICTENFQSIRARYKTNIKMSLVSDLAFPTKTFI